MPAPADPRADDPDGPPPEPPRPDDLDCCGNGCDPCIFDLHAQALQRWRGEMKAWRERRNPGENPGPAEAAS